MPANFLKMASLRTAEALHRHAEDLGVELPVASALESGPDSPLARTAEVGGHAIGNRFCILPMEGWDGDRDGGPTELTMRRWQRFGESGAKLIWGGEAVAVRHDGRANPNQLLLTDRTASGIESLRDGLLCTHKERYGDTDDLFIGLQLTHSGRYARPNEKARPEPLVAYRHPILDPRVGVDREKAILSDDELDRLVDDFVTAAKTAQRMGFAFVDIKHCHGYLGHELLSAFDRPGKYGGSFENRTRFLRRIVEGIRAEAPGLEVGVRLSIFDLKPFQSGADGVGTPEECEEYPYVFGGDGTLTGIDLTEPIRFLALLLELDIKLVCTTAGSPYYCPHVQRPAAFPPSDGYLPPEDPLAGVARQIQTTATLKQAHPELFVVGSGYSYLQDWLPNVAQAAVESCMVDSVGLGRMVLSYPDLPADVLAGKTLTRKKVCRTFSDCTTAPRNGMVSGCFPLDAFYKTRPENQLVTELRKIATK